MRIKDGYHVMDVADAKKVENHDGNNEIDADDTATESYYDGDTTDQESQLSYDDDDDGRPLPMPPLKYARIMGCLPRDGTSTSLSVKITSSTMGRVVVQPSLHNDKNLDSISSDSRHGDRPRSDENVAEWTDADEEADMASIKVHHVLALGFEDGKVRLVDILTGGSVLFGSSPDDGGAWFVHPSKSKRVHDHLRGHAIVALSFDSSSSYLSALNANGDAAIFGPLIWGKQTQVVQSAVSGVRLGFLSSIGGKVSEPTNSDCERSHASRPAFTLVKPPASTVRFTYADPQSLTSSLLSGGSSGAGHGYHPTCMVLDPSYGRRKERALIVGFDDGRLILSKIQGTSGLGSGITSLFGGGTNNAAGGGTIVTKVDSVLYQGTGATSFSGENAGIQAVTWRGGLVAWADSSGVRIFDVEFMSRIAHIDRPTGARSSLYPTISTLHPSILFERSDSLLIGWGDCLMAMIVRDTQCILPASKDGTPAKEIKRKTVEVTMAWELDCVACSVVPLDEKHVAVLGLIPSPEQSFLGGESEHLIKSGTSCHTSSTAGGNNQLELQIINREDGKAISNDRLPLSDRSQRLENHNITTANAAEFRLLSSFACPRMDASAEWDALGNLEKEAAERETCNLGSESACGKILDFHLRWDITKDVCSAGNDLLSEAVIYDDDRSVASDCSIFSDNYVFALSEPIGDILPLSDFPARSSPPEMIVVSSYDACLIQTRDVDDVISYTRSLGKPALALRQALAHRRDVRRHGLDLLVDDFFMSLLGMGNRRRERPLSFSRLKIAAESLPILLGGDSRMWQRWIFMFSRVPGGLFVISEKIPVRDPELPKFVFEMCLEKMLDEAISNGSGHDCDTRAETSGEEKLVGEKMADLFLDTLRSWGSTSALRRRSLFHRYFVQNQLWGLQWRSFTDNSAVSQFTQRSEKSLQRRFSQTAFGVLANTHHSPACTQVNNDSTGDSLFDVEHLLGRLAQRLQLREHENMTDNCISSNVLVGSMKVQCAVLVESLAELELMRERFDRALGYYLVLGSHFMDDAITNLEETAVRIVNSFDNESISSIKGQELHLENEKYSFVLSLIELHQLASLLLKRNFFFDNEGSDSGAESPVVALLMLVGLTRAGRFLLENCSLPEDTQIDYDEEPALRGSNLPLDCVVKQLKPRPKLLYWFLFQILVNKAEIFVDFPTTAVPPPAIIELHQTQFSLFVDYATGENASESTDEKQTSLNLVNCRDTPFMTFLRAALPHGGIHAGEVRERLEKIRGGNAASPFFARELAFVIENFGRGSIDDSNEILHLYLLGAKNLHLAVAYAERSSKHSDLLWDKLIEHCTTPSGLIAGETHNSAMGARFGSLLEAAAQTGSDVANLVSKIPTGMSIEGLRPKLIAAVSDARNKLKMHDRAAAVLLEDKVSILRELSHVSRRGERISVDRDNCVTKTKDDMWSKPSDLLKSSRQTLSPVHPAFSLPIR